ncbi:SGNH/GDSL hydrolase family protein [Cohnella sp. GCM10027633]|uniref:SGNH/GDSL hydrolase family protein n=1 Tax=unclassified Cohnella TaxID=2636738 RepID=UPI00362C1A01
MLRGFWLGDTMYDESLLMTAAEREAVAEACLLFEPITILEVRSARRDSVYEEGQDWVFEDGKLKLTPDSRIPVMTLEEMYPLEHEEGKTMPKLGGGYVLYREGSYLHDRQIVVTYTHAQDAWQGPKPRYAGESLRRTLAKLRQGEPLRIVAYGDSITVGANASGWSGAPPYSPIWPEQLQLLLEAHYRTSISLTNRSLGGADSKWGADNAAEAASERPDLALIAFGMNDGAGEGVDPDVYEANIRAIVESFRRANPLVECILVGTTLANPETFFLNRQPEYMPCLERIAAEREGTAAADMTGVHRELLRGKRFADMTGNHINHPNDYLSRCYAQFVAGMLIESE